MIQHSVTKMAMQTCSEIIFQATSGGRKVDVGGILNQSVSVGTLELEVLPHLLRFGFSLPPAPWLQLLELFGQCGWPTHQARHQASQNQDLIHHRRLHVSYHQSS